MDASLLNEITRNIGIALKEDQTQRDLTSRSCFPHPKQAQAKLILKQDATLAGLILLPLLCYHLDPKIVLTLHVSDSEKRTRGTILATLEGPIHSLLALERTALNFIQHATSIATQTAAYVHAVKGLSCEILDTRKTLPGHRFLQKYAVSAGGGKNHRFHLADQVLIKDNHLAHLKNECGTPITESITRARSLYPKSRIQVEVTNFKELKEACAAQPDAILLDNMSVSEVAESVNMCPEGIYLEASGGINLKTVRSYAETKVHGISIGRLTHSIDAVDMSLEI